MTIVVTGGSGFIGTALCKRLLDAKHTVIVVAKVAPPFTHKKLFFIYCDLETQSLPYNILERTDAVIHLVGKSIYRKWKKNTKEEIKDSRVESTKRIVESIKEATSRPTVFISASSSVYYGETRNATDENSPNGSGFLPNMISEWENAALLAEDLGIRVVLFRSSTIFGHGGFLSLIRRITKFKLLWRLTKENFSISWVHENDVVNAYLFALETKTVHGVLNLSSPSPVSSNELFGIIAKKWKYRLMGLMPKFLIKLYLGELYPELIRNEYILSTKLADKGFEFEYKDAESAIRSLKNSNES